VVGVCLPSLAKQGCKLGPGVRGIHVHYSDRRDPGLRRFAIEQRRRFTGLGGRPEGFFNGDKDCLVNRVGFDRQLDPLATAVDDGEHRFPSAGDQHVVLELGHVLLDAPSSEKDHGSMTLAPNTALISLTSPSRVAAIQGMVRWIAWRWTSAPHQNTLRGRRSENRRQLCHSSERERSSKTLTLSRFLLRFHRGDANQPDSWSGLTSFAPQERL
jgi:hypothetical protein